MKIVNFKPSEIMDMLMESAGVAYYREVCDQTRVVMKDKGEKLEITQERMKTNFGPKLKMLERERARIADYESLKKQIDEKSSLMSTAIRYISIKTVVKSSSKLQEVEANLSNLKSLKQNYKLDLDKLPKKADSTKNEDYQKIEQKMKNLREQLNQKEQLRHEAKIDADSTRTKLQNKQQGVNKLLNKISESNSSLSQASLQAEASKEKLENLTKKLKDIEEEKYDLTSKLESGKDSDAATPIELRIKKLENDLNQLKDKLDADKKSLTQSENSLKGGQKNKEKHDEEIKQIQAEIDILAKEAEAVKTIVYSILL